MVCVMVGVIGGMVILLILVGLVVFGMMWILIVGVFVIFKIG